MAGLLDGVDQRTNLIGENRMELLLFQLNSKQKYGINVFKVREVLNCPALTNMPQSPSIMRGLTTIRGKTIPVLDLGMAIGEKPIEDVSQCFLIISEYNRTVQGFLVRKVEHIVNMNWNEVKPPPKGVGSDNYMTAVTEVNGQLVEIIDVEKVLVQMTGINTDLSEEIAANEGSGVRVLVVDDSSVARNQIQRTLKQLGMECILAENGREALDILKEMADASDVPVSSQVNLVVSDIEMPVMDGYTFVSSVRADQRLKDLLILMHTSMSGSFNDSMVKKAGADKFIPKFNADELAKEVKAVLDL
ncbi:MAG: chemotaxis protein [Thioalkalispiraceae bacterium]|jgi:two-component system chemotaxis response regulator CheV